MIYFMLKLIAASSIGLTYKEKSEDDIDSVMQPGYNDVEKFAHR